MPRASLFLCILLCAFGCAKKKVSPALFRTMSFEDAQRIASSAQVFCKDQDCHPSVGMLTSASREGVGACTATLMGSDLAVTNGHCLPPETKRRGASCEGYLWITFTDDRNHRQYDKRIGCKEVVEYSEEGGLEDHRPDYAILRLSHPTSRPFLAIDETGFSEEETIFMHKVNPDLSARGAFGFLQEITCKTIFASHLEPRASHPLADLVTLGDCPVISGNSGSSLLSQAGHIKGVVQIRIFELRMAAKLRQEGITLLESLVPVSIGTNFACLGVSGQAQPQGCAASERNDGATRAQADAIFERGLARSFENHMLRYVDYLLWDFDLIREVEKNILALKPRCTPRTYLHLTRPPSFTLPQLHATWGWDRYGRESGQVAENPDGPPLHVSFPFRPGQGNVVLLQEGDGPEQTLAAPYCDR